MLVQPLHMGLIKPPLGVSLCFAQKITLEDLSESRSALDEKSGDRSHSVNSMQTATHETTNVAVYEVTSTGGDITFVASACMYAQYLKMQ